MKIIIEMNNNAKLIRIVELGKALDELQKEYHDVFDEWNAE